MEKEIWVALKEDSDYEASNLGRIRKVKDAKLLAQSLNKKNGYYRVYLHRKRYYVHRLVFNAFFDGADDRPIRHIDGNKRNNFIGNLEQM